MTGTGFDSRLAEYGLLTRQVIESHLAGREPRRWLWDLVVELPRRGGKSIRPALCLATCRAFGGRLDDALGSAAAIELLHDAFLVHDDVEDESLERRGAPTLHRTEGIPLAVNTGDAMLVAALQLLGTNRERLGPRMASAVTDEFDTMLEHTLGGQALELGWRRDGVVDLDEEAYLDLIMRKTCWYTTVNPMRVGALIGGWGAVDLDPMIRFGFFLGAAFQIRDDLLNLVGDHDEYGKEPLGDLYEAKRTLMLIHLLRAAEGDRPDPPVGLPVTRACRPHGRRGELGPRAHGAPRQHRPRTRLRGGDRRRRGRGVRGRVRRRAAVSGPPVRRGHDRFHARPRRVNTRDATATAEVPSERGRERKGWV